MGGESMKVKDLAVAVVFAALYVAIGFVLQSVAFGPIQVRVADALYPLIAMFFQFYHRPIETILIERGFISK